MWIMIGFIVMCGSIFAGLSLLQLDWILYGIIIFMLGIIAQNTTSIKIKNNDSEKNKNQ